MSDELTAEPSETVLVARLRRLCATGAAKTIRESASLSLRDVGRFIAQRTGKVVPAPTLSRWERGESRPPDSREACAYALLLGELLGEMAVVEAALAPQTAQDARRLLTAALEPASATAAHRAPVAARSAEVSA